MYYYNKILIKINKKNSKTKKKNNVKKIVHTNY